MDRTCDVCGRSYTAKLARARYCSPTCRSRASKVGLAAPRGARAERVVPLEPPPRDATDRVSNVESTRRALEDAGQLDTWLGASCMSLAERLDRSGVDTGSALASVAKQHAALMTEATKAAAPATRPQQLQDELAERRRRHA